MYGLRHPPHPEGGQEHEDDDVEELVVKECPSLRSDGVGDEGEIGVGKERTESLPPVHLRGAEQHEHRDHDAHDHDGALDEVRDGGGEIAAEEEISRRQTREDEDAPHGVDAERRLEDIAHALIDGRGVRQQEYEDDERGEELDILALIPLLEKLGHGARAECRGHILGAVGEHQPRGEGAEEHVAHADPHRGETEVPAELARITDKDDGGEIGRAVRERAEPSAHALVREHEALHAGALAPRDESHGENDRHVYAEDEPLRPHLVCRRDQRKHPSSPISPVLRGRCHLAPRHADVCAYAAVFPAVLTFPHMSL